MERPPRPKIKDAPGLKWRWRARSGRWVPYWVPRDDAVKRGYPSGTVSLDSLWDGTEASAIVIASRCKQLQTTMLHWLAGDRLNSLAFDGTIGSALDLYERHPDSPFHKLKPGSRHPYSVYLRRLRSHIGEASVAMTSGPDVMRWWKVWTDGGRKLAAGSFAVAVLKEAMKFGALCRYEPCRDLLFILRELSFPKPAPRDKVMTAEHVEAVRAAAHANGNPSRALAYAFQFETALRQWDVIGQWYPLDYPITSDVIGPRGKWHGLRWSNIDEHMILRFRPSKTDATTGAEVVIDLKLCPMVLEEIARVTPEKRVGPVVVYERTRLPYTQSEFWYGWRKDRKGTGIGPDVWSRDLRASAVTEATRAGSNLDDAAKVAGHSTKRTTAKVYDRARLEAARRFQEARLTGRHKSGT